jgi:hypothetical protein
MDTKPRKPTSSAAEPAAPHPNEVPERSSTHRKSDLVLRLLRSEALDAGSRECRARAHGLESWKRVVHGHGARRPKSRAEPEEPELTR